MSGPHGVGWGLLPTISDYPGRPTTFGTKLSAMGYRGPVRRYPHAPSEPAKALRGAAGPFGVQQGAAGC